MSRLTRCEEGSCEFIPSVNKREPLIKRSKDEIRYGRLWAEIELPKLLALTEQSRQRHIRTAQIARRDTHYSRKFDVKLDVCSRKVKQV